MVHYRRYYIPGAIYFFTVTLCDRESILLTQHIHGLREAMRQLKKISPYIVHAMVVLPDHLHAIWELPEGDANFSFRWRYIKSYFTKALIKQNLMISKNKRGEYKLWQKRFWEHFIRNDKDYQAHVDYIHYNPVKHGLVKKVSDWPYSTFHHYVREGVLTNDWCYQNDDLYAE